MKKLVFNILLLLGLVSCFHQEDYLYPNYSEIICVSTSSDTILADGISQARIVAEIQANSNAAKSEVSFKTTKGSLDEVGATSATDLASRVRYYSNENCFDTGSLAASSWLISDLKPGYATVQAEVQNVKTNTLSIYFENAPVQALAVSLDKFKVLSDITDQIVVTATVARTKGKPSLGQEVSFRILDENLLDASELFYFSREKGGSDANAQVAMSFVVADSNLTGRYLIEATTQGENGELSVTREFVVD